MYNRYMFFDYAQLLLLSLFALIITVRYLVSVTGGVKPVLIFRRGKSVLERLAEMAPVAGIGLLAMLVLRNVVTPHTASFLGCGFTMPLFLQGTGFILALLSFVFLVGGYRALGTNWRVGTGDAENGELVTKSIFAYTRNPVYLFFNGFAAGIFLINGDYLMLALFVFVAAGLHLLILQEERTLRRKFGSAYAVYAAKVPRYFRFFAL